MRWCVSYGCVGGDHLVGEVDGRGRGERGGLECVIVCARVCDVVYVITVLGCVLGSIIYLIIRSCRDR